MGERRDVSFTSEGTTCRGWLYPPGGGAPVTGAPAVVMANAFSAVKEIHLDGFARRFADAGLAVLAFDYRTSGGSDGEPRSQVVPHDQLQDLRNAISWLGAQSEVDAERIGAWGVSLGGGHALQLGAFDPRVKAVVAMIPAINQWQNLLSAMPREAFDGLLGMLAGSRQSSYGTDRVDYMPLIAPPPGQAMMGPEAYEFYTEAQATVAPSWENRVTVASLEQFVSYDPAGAIELVAPTPLLMIPAADDQIIPLGLVEAAFARAGEPKKMIVLPCGHTEVYRTEPFAGQAADAAADWFVQHLSAQNPSAENPSAASEERPG